MRIGYVLDRFPSLYQTFVLNELLALESQGTSLAIFSLQRPGDRVQPAAAGLRAPVAYAPPRTRVDRYLAAAAGAIGHTGGNMTAALGARRRVVAANWLRGTAMAPRARALGITHVHAHFAAGANVAAMAMARHVGVPFSFTSHAVDLYARAAWLCETTVAAAFHATISEYNRQFVIERCGPQSAERVHVVRAGIDPAAFAVPDRQTHDPPLVLAVGRLVPKKGHRHLVAALAQVRDRGLGFRATIVGDGPEAAAIAADIARHDLASVVELREPGDQSLVRALYAAADVFALACVVAPDGDRDGIPVSLMEALAAGLPVVSTTVSGIPELVTPDVGLLVSPGDIEALADALATLLADPARRLALGTGGPPRIAAEFDCAVSAARLSNLFQSAAP